MSKECEEVKEMLCALIVMLTFNSNGKMVSRDSCESMLKRLKGEKWSKEFDSYLKNP